MSVLKSLEENAKHPNPPRCADIIAMPQGIEVEKVQSVLRHMLNDNVQVTVNKSAIWLTGDYAPSLVMNINFALKFLQIAVQVLDKS